MAVALILTVRLERLPAVGAAGLCGDGRTGLHEPAAATRSSSTLPRPGVGHVADRGPAPKRVWRFRCLLSHEGRHGLGRDAPLAAPVEPEGAREPSRRTPLPRRTP